MPDNFVYAPPPKTVDGLLAVPMDIQSISGSVVFNAASSSATADVTVNFLTGIQAGCPVFDLRQTISSAWLDGSPISSSNLTAHNFGGGTGAELRIVNSVLPPGTSHTLRLVYTLALPSSPAGGSYPPNLSWSAGPRLLFNFGFTDLKPGRYLESWLPANLIYDQFALTLDVSIINTAIAHSVITNGTLTTLSANHWQIAYPARFTALSPMLEIRATDALQKQTGSVVLPVSGLTVTIEAWKPAGSATDLTAQINTLKTLLTANENNVGSYIHGNRFVVFFAGGGMEYEGGTTAGTGTLKHEAFHSWWARGIKPSSQPDGWWDEAWTTYFNDEGGSTSTAFDFTAPPIELSPQNKWRRETAGNAYSDGSRFWRGMSSLVGNAALKTFMRDLYAQKKGSLCSTADMEEHLLCRSGVPLVVDAFHKFVFGFNDPASVPDLWLKDDVLDTTGGNEWSGRFWDSPDVWVRNADDNGTSHQAPEFGQDNWIYARVRNKSAGVTVKHFAVAFNIKQFAGTQFTYPADFFPCIAAATGFDLAPGASTIVKARWPKAKVPVAGTHGCLLAAVITRREHPVAGKHVWENNNLAQKNLAIVDVKPNGIFHLPFVIANHLFEQTRSFSLQVIKAPQSEKLPISFLHINPQLFTGFERIILPVIHTDTTDSTKAAEAALLDCGGLRPDARNGAADAAGTTDRPLSEMVLKAVLVPEVKVPIRFGDQLALQLKVQLPPESKSGEQHRIDVVQRDEETQKITGGIAVVLNVK